MRNRDVSELVNIGRIGSSVGLRGEVRVILYAQDSDNLKEGKVLLLKRAAAAPKGSGAQRGSAPRSASHGAAADLPREISAACTGVRHQHDKPVIRIEGINDRTAADSLRGMEIYITADSLEELPEGEHYVRDIIGSRVVDVTTGKDIGILSDVIQNTAQSILDIRTEEGRQVLIPAVDAFLKRIDEDAGIIEVAPIPGMID